MYKRMNENLTGLYKYFVGTGDPVSDKKNQEEDDAVYITVEDVEDGWNLIGSGNAQQDLPTITAEAGLQQQVIDAPQNIGENDAAATVEPAAVSDAGMENARTVTSRDKHAQENPDSCSDCMEEEFDGIQAFSENYPEGEILSVNIVPDSGKKSETFAGFFSTLFNCCRREELLDQVDEQVEQSPVRYANGGR